MAKEGLALERCCQQLVTLGKRQGGYITYQGIIDMFRASECDVSMEALDWVYERLIAEGIELVDQLPDSQVVNRNWQRYQEVTPESPQRPEVVPRRRHKRYDYYLEEDLEQPEPASCLEEAIDNLLFQAGTGPLSAKDILTLIEDCRLSSFEVRQLFDYLGSKGIDVPEVDLSQVYRNASEEDNEMQGEEEPDLFADLGVQMLLQDIGRQKKLTASEERRLACLAEEGDWKAASRLIEANLGHVFNLATNYVGLGMDLLDLFQEGCIGLMKALKRFDWRRGFRLSTYSSWWIFQTISRAIADHGRAVRLPAHLLETVRRLQNINDDFYQVHGREPTAEEIAGEMDLPEWRVRELQAVSQPILSWEATLAEWEEMGTYPTWFLEKYGASPDHDLNWSLLQEVVAKLMASLKPREEQVLRLRFGFDGHEPQTLEEVGQHFGVTRERIRQIEAKALKRLRHHKRSNELRDLLG
ncbi:sigma-70 family RNA polymerase sigma factor [Neomoorella mulderi]|uniref:RNA polymerase sigma factor n=1 Tax=Moorella mulderi DSM 14980 TaxID=1122241 RepID=A0A151AW31_9FIRM|nr:sigma-70 family RNA polymerase sigma factor [Moorella mulderi]KYH31874.1 RNA polymerase sigma factor SigA [Moorella mulderi DSM 14980]